MHGAPRTAKLLDRRYDLVDRSRALVARLVRQQTLIDVAHCIAVPVDDRRSFEARLRLRKTRTRHVRRSSVSSDAAASARVIALVAAVGVGALLRLLRACRSSARRSRSACRVASCTSMMPRAHSPATKSKCGVSPRTTTPSATSASKRSVSMRLRHASGSSKHPGTS